MVKRRPQKRLYNRTTGQDKTISGTGSGRATGGPDRTVTLEVVADDPGDAFVVNTALSGSFFDPSRSGEGFFIEILSEVQALLFWSTYDDLGGQRWLFGDGTIRGNEISFGNLAQPTGGTFGSAFDPDSIDSAKAGAGQRVLQAVGAGALYGARHPSHARYV